MICESLFSAHRLPGGRRLGHARRRPPADDLLLPHHELRPAAGTRGTTAGTSGSAADATWGLGWAFRQQSQGLTLLEHFNPNGLILYRKELRMTIFHEGNAKVTKQKKAGTDGDRYWRFEVRE